MSGKEKVVSGIGLVLLLVGVFQVYAGVPDVPHDADAMWIEPESVELSTDTHTIGYKFNVTLWINLTKTCTGWMFKMIYNKNQLNVTACGYLEGITPGKSQFFENITSIPVEPDFDHYNATHDYLLHGEGWIFGPMRNPGYGGLEWVEFEVITAPDPGETLTSIISISTEHHPPFSRTYALDETGVEIPLTVGDCLYTFTYPAVLSTAVYFNLNPNPAGVGETVTLRGILIDEFSQSLADETVRLYARPLAGSWKYITSLTTNEYGIFTWQAKIPLTGTFIFAVYYPGSETYESTYNFAILIVQ